MPFKEPSEPWREWEPLTTEKTLSGGRSLDEYERVLGFNRNELQGKTVLDLGSSEEDYFSSDLKAAKIKVKAISVNPDLALGHFETEHYLDSQGRNNQYVAALGAELPFPDNNFDVILALESVSRYSNPNKFPEAAKRWTKECSRILKPGGKAIFLHSHYRDSRESYANGCNKIVKLLKAAGLKVDTEFYEPIEGAGSFIRIIARKEKRNEKK